MDFNEELVIEITAQWGRDCIECADTLARVTTDYKAGKTVVVCTCDYIRVKGDLLTDLIDRITLICFNDLEKVAELFNCACDEPIIIIDEVWKECNRLTPLWGELFDGYKERLCDLL